MRAQHPFTFCRKSVYVIVLLIVQPVVGWAQQPGPDMAQLQQMRTFLDLMQNYFAIIEATHAIHSDPEKSAILQLNKLEEIYKERGERARVIEEFRHVLETSRNPTIRNAAYMMLGEALKETGRADEAVTLLKAGLAENIEKSQ